jgi:serine protease Do
VRFVYPEGPAAKAGVQIGDEIRSVNGVPAATSTALREMIGTHDRAAQPNVEIEIVRAGKSQKVTVALGSLPTEMPGELPASVSAKPAADEKPVATGLVDIKLPEEPNNCYAFVPPSYHSRVPHGLIVSLHAPGKFNKADVETQWSAACGKHDLIVIAPEASKKEGWEATEADFVRKAIDDAIQRYNIDRTRIVVHGHQAGGTFGYLVAFGNLDIVRGLSTVDAPLPRRVAAPDSDPMQRFAFCFWTASESQFAERITAAIKALDKKKLPVSVRDLGKSPRVLSEVEIGELARWVDSLDRI